jgi:hypothetical protein
MVSAASGVVFKEQLVWKYLEAEEPGMVHMEGEIIINRPADVIFDFVADARNEPRYNPRILCAEKTSKGPIGLDTRFRSETSSMGRTTQWTIEITKYERPRLLALLIHSSSADIQGIQTFDPLDSGTRMRWLWELKPHGVFRLMTPLIGRMG